MRKLSSKIKWGAWFLKSHTLSAEEYTQMKNFVKRLMKIIDKYMDIIERIDFKGL